MNLRYVFFIVLFFLAANFTSCKAKLKGHFEEKAKTNQTSVDEIDEETIADEETVDPTVPPDPINPTGMSFSLLSPYFTNKSTASVSLNCGNATHYLVNELNTIPSSDDVGWQACSNGDFTANVTLSSGEITLRCWFRSETDTISQEALSEEIYQGVVFKFKDPSPNVGDQFGGPYYDVTALSNGNIVIAEPLDDTNGADAGAFHLFSGTNGKIIASHYGDNANDERGDRITDLENGNFVVVSKYEDHSGLTDNGSIMLFDATTGAQIGSTIYGNNSGDRIGYSVIVLPNKNFVAASYLDNEGGIAFVGSAMLIDGETGAQIGSTIYGDQNADQIGREITPLSNSNFFVSSYSDDNGAISDAGSIRLINGSTGAQIGSIFYGDDDDDQIAMTVIALENNNAIVGTTWDDNGAVTDAGLVMLINGTTGAQIGTTFYGDENTDRIGESITVLENNLFVIRSDKDNNGAFNNAGSVMLIDGNTGAQVGGTIFGDNAFDLIGTDIVSLENGNFIIANIYEDNGGNDNVGSIMLINSTDATQIGSTVYGEEADDWFGYEIFLLENNIFAVVTATDTNGGLNNVGSIKLFNGTTGAQIGSTIFGDNANDKIGQETIVLGNGNFATSSTWDDTGGLVDYGSMMLIDGATGSQIGTTFVGNNITDQQDYTLVALTNNNFVFARENEKKDAQNNLGAVMLVNGSTGEQIGETIFGDNLDDMIWIKIEALDNGNFVVINTYDDNGAQSDAGSLRLVDGSTGNQIGSTIYGDNTDDSLGMYIGPKLNNGGLLILSRDDDVDGISDAGSVMMIIND